MFDSNRLDMGSRIQAIQWCIWKSPYWRFCSHL